MPALSIVVVHFDASALVAGVAEAYGRHDHEVIVVDNSGSYTGPGVVVAGQGNVGFGVACNLGVARASNDLVVLHNADVVPDPEAVARLASVVEHPHGVVVPSIDTGRTIRRDGFARPTPLRELYVSHRHLRAARGSSNAEPKHEVPTPPTPSTAVSGAVRTAGRFGSAAVLATTRTAFEQVSGFDERFFLYVEDLDFWVRADAAGLAPGFAPDIVFRHDEKGGSSAVNLEWREVLRWVGVELYASIHTDSWRRFRLAHRAAALGHRFSTSLGRDVLDRWRSGADPSSVAEHVRASVLLGRLHDET